MSVRADLQQDIADNSVAEIVEVEKVKGRSIIDTYKATITDKVAVLRHCIRNPHFLNHIEIKLSPFESIQKTEKGKLEFPGMKFTKSSTVVHRG